MKQILSSLLFATLMLVNSSVFANTTPTAEQQVANATKLWATEIDKQNAKALAALYDPNALLFATFNNKLDTPEEIYDYFVKLTAKKDLAVKFHSQNIRVFEGVIAINSGKYDFSYTDSNDKKVVIAARYTFVYTNTPTGWVITEHHSSLLPDQS